MVSFVYGFTCPNCAYRAKGVMVRSMRINKRSMRSAGAGLGFVPGKCQECGSPLSEQPDRQDVDADDRPKINAYRERKGWEPIRWTREAGR